MKLAFGLFLLIFGLLTFLYPEKLRQNQINSFVLGLTLFGLNKENVDYEKKHVGIWFYKLVGLLTILFALIVFYGLLIRNQ